ncbi:MAG: VPDSG-CTERM sorting domain-containing protein [Verrucomicrobia bacterium]|nr:VPDSG-CTERM sorting domain-containing protein [Verrucomicrobiota bacterium]
MEITARSVDTLIADTVSIVLSGPDFLLGNLTSGNGLSSFIVALSYLDNDSLTIEIDKSNASGSGRNRIDADKIEIVSSKLSVTWETAPSPTNRVPDGGATLALLGFGLMGMAACSRKLGSKKN